MQSAVSSEATQIGKTDCLFSPSGCTINENRRMENARDDMSDSQVQMSTVLREEKRHQGMLRILFRGPGKNLDGVVSLWLAFSNHFSNQLGEHISIQHF